VIPSNAHDHGYRHEDTGSSLSLSAPGDEQRQPRPCARCETLPAQITGSGKLYLWFPLSHTFGKAAQFLRRSGYNHQQLEDGRGVAVALEPDELDRFVAGVTGILTGGELRDTQAVFLDSRERLGLADFRRVTSLQQFINLVQSGWLIDMLHTMRLTTYFQPIVHAADTTRVFAQEALLRGLDADGALIPPGRILDAGRDAGLLFQLDLAARRSAIRQASRYGITSKSFINFNPTAIYDPAFCLRSTVSAIEEVGIRPDNIVFEITESDRSPDLGHLQGILNYYRSAGFGVALDDLGSGYSSLNLIHQLRPDFIKLDMELIRGVHDDPYKAMIAEKLLEIAGHLRIRTVAEGVEHPEELCWVREHGATFVQGYLFARPASPPVTVTPAFDHAPGFALIGGGA